MKRVLFTGNVLVDVISIASQCIQTFIDSEHALSIDNVWSEINVSQCIQAFKHEEHALFTDSVWTDIISLQSLNVFRP